MHTRMDLELVKYMNSDLTWSAVKRGRRSTRRPRNKKQDSVLLDYEKSGVAILSQHFGGEVLDVPIKKRILLLQHQTPSSHHEESELLVKLNNGSSNSENVKQIEKKFPDMNDFSGIELLAAAACVESSAVEEQITPKADSYTNGVKYDSAPMDSDKSSVQNLSDNGNCEVDKCPVPSKSVRLHWDLNTMMDDWEEPCCDILVDPDSEKSYLKDSFNDGLSNDKASQVTEDEKIITLDDAIISVVPLSKPEIFGIQENNDGDPMEEVNAITCKKTSEIESCISKLDVVESFVHSTKCEKVSTITPSVIKVESLNKCDDGQAVSEVVQGGFLSLKGDGDDKLTSEDRLSDCCGSNVSEDEHGRMVEGNAIDKVKSGYDSPVEDGELREPTTFPWEKIELEDKECVDYESDNMYEDNFDTIESVKNEITLHEHQKTNGALGAVSNNDIEQSDKADTSNRPDHREYSQSAILEEKNASSAKFLPERRSVHDESPDRSTSFGVRRNGDCIRRSRSDNFGDSYFRANRDFGPKRFMGRDGSSYHGRDSNDTSGQWVDSNSHGYPRPKNDQSINYNPRVNYRNFNTRPSPSDRNDSYGIHRGAPPARGINRDRSRSGSGLHQQGLRRPPHEEYNDPELCYSERKVPCFSSSFNRGADLSRSRKRSRSRSRSGSPIAWHFQKKINVDTQKQSPERFPYRKPNSSGEIDRNIINGQYRDRRTSPVRTFHRDQRFNNFHPTLRPAGFPQATGPIREKFEVNSDEKYGMMNGGRRFRYDVDSRNKDNGFRYVRKDNRCFRDPVERDIPENRSDKKGCRYTTNKIFNTAEGDFHKDNLQRE